MTLKVSPDILVISEETKRPHKKKKDSAKMTNFQLSKLLKGCNEIDVTISGLDKHIKNVSRRLKAQHKYLAKSKNPDATWSYEYSIEKMTQCLAVLKSIK